MTPAQTAALINAQVGCALAEIEMMKAANYERTSAGQPLTYTDEDFAEIPERFGIGHNTVMQILTEAEE